MNHRSFFNNNWLFTVLVLCACLSIVGAVAAGDRNIKTGTDNELTPAPGTPLRKAVLDCLRNELKRIHGLEVVFVVKHLKVKNGWAWIHTQPQSPDAVHKYEDVLALLEKKNGVWTVVEIPCTEIDNPACLDSPEYFTKLMERFPHMPAAILPTAK